MRRSTPVEWAASIGGIAVFGILFFAVGLAWWISFVGGVIVLIAGMMYAARRRS